MNDDINVFADPFDQEIEDYFDLLNTNTVSLDDIIEQENIDKVFGCDLDCSNCPDCFWCEQNN